MSDLTITWRGLRIGGAASAFGVTSTQGWMGLPGGSAESAASSGHGERRSPVTQGARYPAVTGRLRADAGSRDATLDSLSSVMYAAPAWSTDVEPLTITSAGKTVVLDAQLVQFEPDTDLRWWNTGQVPFRAQWRCPDPRKFGDWLTESAALVSEPAGITLPHMLPFTQTAKPIGGRVSIFNPGNDPEGSPAIFTLTGAQSGTVGISLLSTGATLFYNIGLSAADVLVIDTAKGGAFLNGAYRAPAAGSGVTGGFRLPPGVSVVQALGTAGAGSPSLTVAVRPASW